MSLTCSGSPATNATGSWLSASSRIRWNVSWRFTEDRDSGSTFKTIPTVWRSSLMTMDSANSMISGSFFEMINLNSRACLGDDAVGRSSVAKDCARPGSMPGTFPSSRVKLLSRERCSSNSADLTGSSLSTY